MKLLLYSLENAVKLNVIKPWKFFSALDIYQVVKMTTTGKKNNKTIINTFVSN